MGPCANQNASMQGISNIQYAKSYFDPMKGKIISWRHQLHRNPELAFEEVWTSGFIAAKLEKFGYTVYRGLGKTGVVAALPGKAGPAIGLRVDMDALAIEENNDLPYSREKRGSFRLTITYSGIPCSVLRMISSWRSGERSTK